MRRLATLLLPLALLLALTLGRAPIVAPVIDPRVWAVPLEMPPAARLAAWLGPFRLEGAWQLSSRDHRFYGYSAMIPQPDGRILAINDAGGTLLISPPGAPPSAPRFRAFSLSHDARVKEMRDSEAIARDPASGRYWLGMEGHNAVIRFDSRFREEARSRPLAMRDWGNNSGPEAMARLRDGRFVVIRETTRTVLDPRLHEAVLFDGDPVEHPAGHRFLFDGPANFSVVDMALLPDGRALVLMRRLLWPLPARFAGRIVIADTARIRPGGVWRSTQVASLASTLPVDNFEAIGVEPQRGGRIVIWLMSDDNNMRSMQRTLLWKLSVDQRRLPWPD